MPHNRPDDMLVGILLGQNLLVQLSRAGGSYTRTVRKLELTGI